MWRFVGARTASQAFCLVGMICCFCLPASLVADTKICPLGDAGGVTNASCDGEEGDSKPTCAIYDGRQARCIGWANYRCAVQEYRNMKTCECIKCPVGSGQNCMPGNECCSLADCGTAPASTPKPRPFALSSTSRLHPHAPTHLLVCVVLSFVGAT
jgi:hypothetical protein